VAGDAGRRRVSLSLIRDIRDSFKSKGLEYVSIGEAPNDRKKSLLTYKDASGKPMTKEIAIPFDDLEEAIREVDVIDPDGLADYLLGQ
jgi:hypothetical protein